MYKYKWDIETGGYLLTTNLAGVSKGLRPVFYEELDLLGFDKLTWKYPKTDKPLMWAETRRYIYKGELVAEAVGGGLFTKPTIKLYKDNLTIEPVNIDLMIKKNKPLMIGLVQNTVETIYEVYKKHKDANIDVIYVAFSGGKDSLVLLDLVQRALPHNEFKVIFSDTSMEISDTYKTVEEVKKRYPTLEFHTAKFHIKAEDTWKMFGVPSRILRWCCAVHKSAPALLKLREIIGKNNLQALAFDGIRAEESNSRATYLIEGNNSKHASQINKHPMFEWSSAEVFLYLLQGSLLINNAYRYGSNRVGCLVCPMSSSWKEYITHKIYKKEVEIFLKIIDVSFRNKISDKNERKKYIETGGWKGRIDGRDIKTNGNKIIEQESNDKYSISVSGDYGSWREWSKALGLLIKMTENKYVINYKGTNYPFTIEENENGLVATIVKQPKNHNYIRFMYLFKNIFYKAAYCKKCGVCSVECRFGALSFANNKLNINENCKNCESCLDMPKGCLIAKSKLFITGGKNVMIKGLGNYRGFGFNREWLAHYFELGNNLWTTDRLGKPKYDALKIWLKESEITQNNTITELGEEIKRIGTNSVRSWAVIFNNLVYNATIVKWYIQNISIGATQTRSDIKILFGDDYKPSTKDNAVNSLVNIFRYSPIGSELGAGICEIKGNSVKSITRSIWNNPDPVVILYSLYKFAEKCDGHYSFTLSYLCDDNIERGGISPSKIFGISQIVLKRKIQNLATDHREFISATFNKDLDNIDLVKDKTSLGVLKFFNKS